MMLANGAGSGGAGSGAVAGSADAGGNPPIAMQHILWIGDSITHGEYEPVVSYNRDKVTDELGTHYGGIPGIFAQLASEVGLSIETHVCLISATSLRVLASSCAAVIARPEWQWVVLQEKTNVPLPGGPPSQFCSSVKTIERAVHSAAPLAKVYLYENWPFDSANATLQAAQYHNIFYSSEATEGQITGVSAAGDAWTRAWGGGVANRTCTPGPLPTLWHGNGDCKHPSVYGAYLAALVHFQKITGMSAQRFGANETAANALQIPNAIAVQLQKVASDTVTEENSAPLGGAEAADACP